MSFFRAYLLPGFIFQSVVIAGGYGSGREIVEFFLSIGPVPGLWAIAVATAVWSLVCAVSFEFARLTGSEDYRSFFTHLLGRVGSGVYEACYLAFMVIVLAVIAATAGSILRDTFDLPYLVGVVAMTLLIAGLVFLGTESIERVLSLWSIVLYGVFVVMFGWAFAAFGPRIGIALSQSAAPGGEALIQGVKYAGYNLAIIPALLFSLEHVRSRRQALWSGILAGPIAIVPGAFFYFAMVGLYPEILPDEVPANTVLEALGSRGFQIAFQIMLFGTLVETGTGMIHGVNERLARRLEERGRTMPGSLRTSVALGFLMGAAGIAQFGLIGLIARGYGTLTWVFIIVYVVPILTLGVWKIKRGVGGTDAA